MDATQRPVPSKRFMSWANALGTLGVGLVCVGVAIGYGWIRFGEAWRSIATGTGLILLGLEIVSRAYLGSPAGARRYRWWSMTVGVFGIAAGAGELLRVILR